MNTLPIHSTNPEVTIHGGKAVTTSLAVAEYFQKTHDNVLKKIRSVISECDEEYRLVNFNETYYTRENPNGGAGISTPMYELTRDAFVLIVMGFTGKKALQWKIDYINAFNKMEAELHQPAVLTPVSSLSNYEILITVVNGQPIGSRVLAPGEIIMNPDTCLEHVIRSGYVILPCDEAGKFTLDELQGMVETARKVREHWGRKYQQIMAC